ncbi:MAG TPA: MoxR family ATPase [Planctomycetota bacterium]|nr:MoxR family ATPase [Planctomycetota bacterium]
MIQDAVQQASPWVEPLRCAMRRVVVGQDRTVERLIVAFLANGHVLLEGAPGLAKTLTMKTLATATQSSFKRIQITSDTLPADLLGTETFDPSALKPDVRKGPIFSNLVLAEGINRAPRRVQGALLEAMQERHVAIGQAVFPLPDPFFVLATEDPTEDETRPLPPSQVDRFLLKAVATFPSLREERMILDLAELGDEAPRGGPVIGAKEIREARMVAQAIFVDDRVKDYIVSLVYATREPMGFGLDLDHHIRHGASPRATLGLLAAARAYAFLAGRGYVMLEDVKAMAMDVLRHRVAVTYEAEAEGLGSEDIVRRVIEAVALP